jgi:NAD(P)-dependent dehydrogenase (short-subunit alcohol dehydrogenase family)
MPSKKLQGQVAIVTGASRGIGAATARLLAQEGCAVVLTARDEEWLELAARDTRDRDGRAIAVAADITDPSMVEEVVESALGQFNRVDIVVNAAGTVLPLDTAADTDVDEWAYGVHTNLIGPFYLVNNVLPLMLDQGYGRVVNLTCGAGIEPRAGESALRAAKTGLETWTHVVAKELHGTGVVVSCLDPGAVDTAFRRDILELDALDGAEGISAWVRETASDEVSSPIEVAGMVLWLITEACENRPGHIYRGVEMAWQTN